MIKPNVQEECCWCAHYASTKAGKPTCKGYYIKGEANSKLCPLFLSYEDYQACMNGGRMALKAETMSENESNYQDGLSCTTCTHLGGEADHPVCTKGDKRCTWRNMVDHDPIQQSQPETCLECRFYDGLDGKGRWCIGSGGKCELGECRVYAPLAHDPGGSDTPFPMITPGPACGGFEGKEKAKTDLSSSERDKLDRLRGFWLAVTRGTPLTPPTPPELPTEDTPEPFTPTDEEKAEADRAAWDNAREEAERRGEPMPSKTAPKLVGQTVITIHENWHYGTSTQDYRLPEGMTTKELIGRILGTWDKQGREEPAKSTLEQQVEDLKTQPVWPYLLGQFAEWQRAYEANDTEAMAAWPAFKDGKFVSSTLYPSIPTRELTVTCHKCDSEMYVRTTKGGAFTPKMSAVVEPCPKCIRRLCKKVTVNCERCGEVLPAVDTQESLTTPNISVHVEPCPKCCVEPTTDMVIDLGNVSPEATNVKYKMKDGTVFTHKEYMAVLAAKCQSCDTLTDEESQARLTRTHTIDLKGPEYKGPWTESTTARQDIKRSLKDGVDWIRRQSGHSKPTLTVPMRHAKSFCQSQELLDYWQVKDVTIFCDLPSPLYGIYVKIVDDNSDQDPGCPILTAPHDKPLWTVRFLNTCEPEVSDG